jgi:fucose permease
MVIGQIISLFGNAILRFSLSLHVLSLTGSAAVFGSILALAMVPTVLLSPLGGVVADRVPRQGIMVALDFFTCGLILCFDLFFAPPRARAGRQHGVSHSAVSDSKR